MRGFNLAFLDLLCCALGAVILLALVLILRISPEASQTFDDTFFVADATVWIDIHDHWTEHEERGNPQSALGRYDVRMEILYSPNVETDLVQVFDTTPETRATDGLDGNRALIFRWWRTPLSEQHVQEINGRHWLVVRIGAMGLKTVQGTFAFKFYFSKGGRELKGPGSVASRIVLQGSGEAGHIILETRNVSQLLESDGLDRLRQAEERELEQWERWKEHVDPTADPEIRRKELLRQQRAGGFPARSEQLKLQWDVYFPDVGILNPPAYPYFLVRDPPGDFFFPQHYEKTRFADTDSEVKVYLPSLYVTER